MTGKSFQDFFSEARATPEYAAFAAVLEFTESLVRVMEEQNVSRAELARRLGTSPAYVTKILRGNANFTLASMTRLARALGQELRVDLRPCSSNAMAPRGGAQVSSVRERRKGYAAARKKPRAARRRVGEK
jgi:transcriptional regulator with XRE-family HTH domain